MKSQKKSIEIPVLAGSPRIFLLEIGPFVVQKVPPCPTDHHVPPTSWLAGSRRGEAELCPEPGGATSDLPGNLLAHLSGLSILGVVAKFLNSDEEEHVKIIVYNHIYSYII